MQDAHVGVGSQSWLLVAVCVLALGCGASNSESSTGPVGPGGDATDQADNTNTNNGKDKPNDNGDLTAKNGGTQSKSPDDKGADETSNKTPDEPTVAPKPAKVTRFKTTKSAKVISQFLVKPAKQAHKKRNWPLAISYGRGLVAARGPASPEALELAYALQQELQKEDTLAVLDAFIANTQDPDALKQQTAVRERVATFDNPFSQDFRPVPATKDAFAAFKLGRKAFKAKKYGDALLYFQIGTALAPDLSGFLRELGATYDKLGAADKKVEYLGRYLRQRPFGKNAVAARKLLAKHKKEVAYLDVKSAMACDQVWLNNQLVPKKLPVKKLMVGVGRYSALCYSIRYDIAYFEDVTLKAGGKGVITFNWAVVIDGLRKPYGRIRIESILEPGRFVAVPPTKPNGFGIVVPADGRALEIRLQSMDRSRKETRYLKIPPGSKQTIKW